MTEDKALPSDKKEALERVLRSPSFKDAERLKSFLQYIVTETLEGREQQLLGKNIVSDVYGRTSADDATTVNVVRVDAGRLRRRLDSYYAHEGAQDTIRISVPKGGYVPSFEHVADVAEVKPQPTSAPRATRVGAYGWFAAGFVAAAGAMAVVSFVNNATPPSQIANTGGQAQDELKRSILFDISPARLQARNIADAARGIFFPATQPRRLQASLLLFETAIDLDASFFGDYAGAAQATAMLGGMSPLGPQREQLLLQAQDYADSAIELAPSEAWSHSAKALVLMFQRHFDRAAESSQFAVSLEPEDLRTLEFDAIVAFFAGDFSRALKSSAPDIHEGRGGRFPWRSVYGNASFHAGNYEEAVQYLLEAAALGEPVSEISSVHLIASLQASGRTKDAADRLREFKNAWPNSKVLGVLTQLFNNEEDVKRLRDQLVIAGWNS